MQQRLETVDEGQIYRRRTLYILTLILIVCGALFAAVSLILWLRGGGSLLDVGGGVVVALVGGIVYALDRWALARPASFVAVGLIIAVPIFFLVMEGSRSVSLLLFAAAVVFADLLIGGRSGMVVAVLSVLAYAGIGAAHEFGLLQVTLVSPFLADVGAVALILLGLSLVYGLFTQGMRRFLEQAGEREAALRAADEEKDRLLSELQAREAAQQRLLDTIHELGSPVIPLAEGVIAMPLIGIVDSERAQQVRRALLEGVSGHRARVAIIDITGVPLVDSMVAEALLKAAQGVRLLGAEAVLTGIRAEVAQTIVALGLDLSGVVSRATLQEGLAYALDAVDRSWRQSPIGDLVD